MLVQGSLKRLEHWLENCVNVVCGTVVILLMVSGSTQ